MVSCRKETDGKEEGQESIRLPYTAPIGCRVKTFIEALVPSFTFLQRLVVDILSAAIFIDDSNRRGMERALGYS